VDPTRCYCHPGLSIDDYLINATITGLDYPLVEADLVPESIFKTPEDPEAELVVGEETNFSNTNTIRTLSLGGAGIFIVSYDTQTGWNIEAFYPREDGLYPCGTDPAFEGATEQELVDVILSSDCRSAAMNLGLSYCDDSDGCECPPSDSTTGARRGSVLLVLVMVVGLGIRRGCLRR
jgi:hypothetical protein